MKRTQKEVFQMQIGLAGSLEKYLGTKKQFPGVAIDYCELNAMKVAALSDEDFSDLCRTVSENAVNCYSVNGLVPGSLRLTGPDVSFDAVASYAEKTFSRLGRLGVRMLVFGSSAAKNVPDGFPTEKAWEQLKEVGTIFADTAKKYGQTVAAEGLRREEVNIVNTLADVGRYVDLVARDNFLMHVDFYHVLQNGEDLKEELLRYGSKIVHAHICSSERGLLTESDVPFIRERLELLDRIGYRGNLSYEGSYPENGDYRKGAEMFGILRRFIKKEG